MVTRSEFKSAFAESLTTHLVEINKAEEKRQNKKARDDDINFKKLDDELKKNKEELKVHLREMLNDDMGAEANVCFEYAIELFEELGKIA